MKSGNKKICAMTMARNDDFFLTKWIDYYGSQLGKENLYIFLDGKDQIPPSNAEGTHIKYCVHLPEPVVQADKMRVSRLSTEAAKLLETYDLVIGTDADEFLVVDPQTGKSLVEYLSEIKISPTVSGLGLDVGQKMDEEDAINGNLPFLSQRSYALVSSRYTKSVVISKPVRWGSGFHRVKRHNYRIDKNLYLFHFGCVDLKMVRQRFLDKDRMASGWERHLKKRIKTITIISKIKALDSEIWLPIARKIQTWIRPVYAWNKPTQLHWKLVIKIPERFKSSV
ncbi:glycosyltransferase family 2 protein [Bacteroidales bacterium OttesenSCG-928-A17]|nr:glycosyltransferase family 2 protein [Bacteroidales bacterium OttesenSCG-928-A17]